MPAAIQPQEFRDKKLLRCVMVRFHYLGIRVTGQACSGTGLRFRALKLPIRKSIRFGQCGLPVLHRAVAAAARKVRAPISRAIKMGQIAGGGDCEWAFFMGDWGELDGLSRWYTHRVRRVSAPQFSSVR